jgi:hypothetical protein
MQVIVNENQRCKLQENENDKVKVSFQKINQSVHFFYISAQKYENN